MINPADFYSTLKQFNIDFFTGVPDSLLKSILSYITANSSKEGHIIAVSEGGAVGLAIGHYLSTGNIPMVYLQNSGLGNIVNPLLSLADKEVYGIPMLLMIGWRGEPGVKDEPQHVKQGRVTTSMLDAMEIPYEIIEDDYKSIIEKQINLAKTQSKPVAILIRKNTFEGYDLKTDIQDYMSREDAIKCVVDELNDTDIVVATTGKPARELFEYRIEKGQGNDNDFLTVGGMGHASSIALGIALNKKDRTIVCMDGDGAALMHLGSMGIIAATETNNFLHILLNNEAHDSVGGQPTIGDRVDFPAIAKGLGYGKVLSVSTKSEIADAIKVYKSKNQLTFIEVKIRKGARKDLGRPTKSPIQNKEALMNVLSK